MWVTTSSVNQRLIIKYNIKNEKDTSSSIICTPNFCWSIF